MYLLGSVVEENLGVVSQLGAAHYGVVAAEQALALEEVFVGNEFHLGHQVAHFLIGGHEGARPGGGVFGDAAQVGYLGADGIARGHAHA